MKIFTLILGILIVLDIMYFSYVNSGEILTLNYQPLIDNFDVPSGWFYFVMGIYGLVGGVLISLSKIFSLKDELKKFRRKTEKSTIESEENQDRVKDLEAKIKTLESALKDALNKNN